MCSFISPLFSHSSGSYCSQLESDSAVIEDPVLVVKYCGDDSAQYQQLMGPMSWLAWSGYVAKDAAKWGQPLQLSGVSEVTGCSGAYMVLIQRQVV